MVGALAACAIFPAVADDGKPRYVAGGGRDTGDCMNRFRPCRTLSYATSQAGKGDGIQVAEGTYTVANSQQLYDLLAVGGRIAAGFSKVSSYSERTASAGTMLVGVPPEFRERFEAAGFTVIVDTKGLNVSADEAQRMRKLTAQFTAVEASQGAAACTANVSAGFPCQSVSLLSHLGFADLKPASMRGNDVWGFMDLNTGREYALMGLANGVAVVDITNPEAPRQVGSASGTNTTWRDMKVYQLYDTSAARWRAFAYATADAVQDSLIVLDLSGLPNSVATVNYNSDFRAAHNEYIVNADYTFGLAQTNEVPVLGIAGAGINSGNYRLYSLANPRSPSLLNVATFGYAHDIASFPITDARKNTQCVNAATRAQCQVLSDFNENTLDIWDVSNPAAPQRLSSQPYANVSYVHSGWWSEDGNFLFVHDELDERNFGLNTTVRVFDMSDLLAPALAGSWVGPTRAIDHNGFVKGNRYYIANYSEGLTVLDISDPRAPTRVGYFDTFPTSSATDFVGAWGVYPFFASGTVAVADINSGLYLLRNETLATPRGTFSMASASLAGLEGQSVAITVNRSAGSGAVSVQLEALFGSAGTADATLSSTTLSWADGDMQPKQAMVTLASDAQAENLELLMVRLESPQGGASIGYPDTTRVTIGDVGQSSALRPLETAFSVVETLGEVLVTVIRNKSALGATSLSYRIVPGAYAGVTATQGEIEWADGDALGKVISVPIAAGNLGTSGSATFQVELSTPMNSALETPAGQSVTTLPVVITVTAAAAATAPPTPTPTPTPTPMTPTSSRRGGGGGGGAVDLVLLALLALVLAARMYARRRAA
jgi:choice-of-anchor B domain-containing protein